MPLPKLEPYSGLKLISQSKVAKNLVQSERDLLTQTQPDTLERYRNRRAAFRSVFRSASSMEVNTYIIKKQQAAVGLATIIANQRVIHPSEGLFEGYDLDYWIKPAVTSEDPLFHGYTANALIARAAEMHSFDLMKRRRQMFDENCELPPFKAIASIVQGHPNPAIGFEEVMRPIGEVAVLATDIPNDPYGMARDGQSAQLYYYAKG